jgi:hypothetical protein
MHDFSPLGDAKPSMAAFNLPPGLKNMPKTALREVRPARLECRLKKPWMIAHGIEFLLVCTTPRGFLDCFNLV